MKKSLLFTIAAFVGLSTQAQFNVGGALKNKINQKANEQIDKSVDNAVNGNKKKKDQSSSENKNESNENSSSNATSTSSTPSKKEDLVNYAKYDFVPGDKIIFDDNIVDEKTGEFPSKWDLRNGNIEIAQVNGESAIAFIDGNYAEITPLMAKQGDYLPNQFSIECDVYFTAGGYNHLNFLLYDDKSYNGDNIGDLIHWGEIGEYSSFGNANSQYPNSGTFDDRWHHVAISYNKGSMKAYIDQYRVLNIPKINGEPQGLTFGVIADPAHPIFLKNIRMAEGGAELYKRVSTEGKIITHGINFDVNKSTIKPYSMGTINEIAKLMKDNPTLNFSVEGHTDSDGDEAANLKLSKERAEAVKTELIKLGIDASRLSTQGWGESKPLDSSDTPEAKANNRRVEFVKK